MNLHRTRGGLEIEMVGASIAGDVYSLMSRVQHCEVARSHVMMMFTMNRSRGRCDFTVDIDPACLITSIICFEKTDLLSDIS